LPVALQAWLIAKPNAAEYSVTWEMNVDPPPVVGSAEPRWALQSQMS
jgi:hypothetical protein